MADQAWVDQTSLLVVWEAAPSGTTYLDQTSLLVVWEAPPVGNAYLDQTSCLVVWEAPPVGNAYLDQTSCLVVWEAPPSGTTYLDQTSCLVVWEAGVPVAVVPDISGAPTALATFDGSGSQYLLYYAWEWTSVPGGSAIANAPIPFPDAGATTPFNMTGNQLLLHFEEASGVTAVEYPDNGANTPIDMTGNVGLWHYNSIATATATAFPGSISMTSIEMVCHFDGDADDSSGNSVDGTVNGATQVTGIVGANAYSFDGSNDTIDFGANLQYTTGDFSFSVWLKPVAAQNTWACVFGTHGINGGYALQQRDNNTNRYRVQTGSGGVFGATNTDFALIADIWSHVVITREGTVIKGYVNGNHVYTDVSVATISNALNFVAGNYTQSGWSGYYKGEMDELASWSRALSAAEALAIYNEQVSGQYTPGTGPNEVKGWLYNSPTLTAAKVGAQALDFDGTDQYLQGTITPAPTTAGSWACWFKFNSFNSSHNYIAGFGSPANVQGSYRAIMYYSGELYFWGYAADYHITQAPITSGIWYHLTLTWENTDDVKVYLNGVLVYSATIGALTTPVTEFYVGKRPDIAQYSDMECDELAIWSRVLSDAEVADIYVKQSAGGIKDSSGQDNHLINYGATSVPGKIGTNGADFNGTDQRMDGVLVNGPTTAGTIAGWLRLNTNPADLDPMFGLGGLPNSSYQGNARGLLIRSSRRLYFVGYWKDQENVSDALTVGQWYHVAMTWENTSTMVVYIDGAPYKTWVEGGLTAPAGSFFIGKRPGNSGSETYYSDITVDEIAVWNRTLSQAEIADIYDYQSNSYAGPKTATLAFTPDIAGTYTVQLEVAPGVTTTADAVIGTSGPENIDSIFGISKDNIGTIMGITYGDIDKINDID